MLECENFHDNFWSHHKTSVLLPEKWSEFMISARTHICQWAQKKKFSDPIDRYLLIVCIYSFFQFLEKQDQKFKFYISSKCILI